MEKTGMKKLKLTCLIIIILCGALLIWVAAISDGTGTTETKKSQNVLLNAELKEVDVVNAVGNVIGTRAYIDIQKEELVALTQEEFKEFIDEVVKDSEYNYVTIIAEDAGKAILFPSSMVELAQYGLVNVDGTLKSVHGYISLQKDGTYKYESK